MNFRYFIIVLLLVNVELAATHFHAFAADGVEWGRIRIIPTLAFSERYSDNIYLETQDETDNYISTITPEVSFDAAIVPRNYISVKYRGDFLVYSDADNFKKNNHFGSLSFNGKTAKDSHFIAGISVEDTAVQPFSVEDVSKDFTEQSAYADVLLSIGKVIQVGTEYTREDREFEEQQFSDDDFKRDTWDLHLLYTKSLVWPLLMQYRYINQENNDLDAINTDFKSHTIFLGARWQSASKLSGALRVGYLWAEFEDTGAQEHDGYAIDTDLNYAYSDITKFTLRAERSVQQPTRSARESGDYYVSTGAGLIVSHNRWERITTRLSLFLRNRDYKEIQSSGNMRQDDYYRSGLSLTYLIRSWLSLTLGYRYQENSSNIEDESYTENLIECGLKFSM